MALRSESFPLTLLMTAREDLALPVRTRGLSGGRSAPAEGGSASGGSESFPLTLIDSHCHLNFRGLKEDTAGVIERAKASGVDYLINIGVGDSLDETEAAVRLAQSHETVFASVGVHPHEAVKVVDADLARLEELAGQPKVVAIGEVGLDYHYEHSPADIQKKRLREFVRLARRVNLPLILHIRDAFAEAYEIVGAEGGFDGKGVVHCFTGTQEWADKFRKSGFFISFSGIVTFKKSTALQDAVRALPVEAMLVETDAPYLTPEPYRGKTNEPAYVVKTAEKIAELKKLSIADVARITSRNTRDLFDLPIEFDDDVAKIVYSIRDSLYLNITNRCTIACVFCPKFDDWMVKGHYLRLRKEPTVDQIWAAIGDVSSYKEVVFCGYGESTQRLDVLKEIARRLKSRARIWLRQSECEGCQGEGASQTSESFPLTPKEKGKTVRLDTDGLANLIHGRNILPELKGLIDSVSISLNAADAATYAKLCPSKYGEKAYSAVVDFIREAKKYIPDVQATVVGMPEIDRESCRKIVEDELGVRFRFRTLDNVG